MIVAPFPLALGFGIAGIVTDRQKLLAAIVTSVAGIFLLYLCAIGILALMT